VIYIQEYLTPRQFKKKYMPKLRDIPVCDRGSGKTIMNTQRLMGTIYAKEFYELLKSGEQLTEQDYLDGLKGVYAGVGRMFYGGDEDEID
jgi:hypothetical protein